MWSQRYHLWLPRWKLCYLRRSSSWWKNLTFVARLFDNYLNSDQGSCNLFAWLSTTVARYLPDGYFGFIGTALAALSFKTVRISRKNVSNVREGCRLVKLGGLGKPQGLLAPSHAQSHRALWRRRAPGGRGTAKKDSARQKPDEVTGEQFSSGVVFKTEW